jgi:sedoheptulose-bisphosphatase
MLTDAANLVSSIRSSLFILHLFFIVIMSAFNSTAAEKQQAYAISKASSAASSTSIYTTEEKKDHYATLPEVLALKCKDPQVRQVIQDLMQVCADITDALRISLVTVEGSTNDFGDSQLSVDVSETKLLASGCNVTIRSNVLPLFINQIISDQLLWEACRKSSVIREGASEEEPEVRNMDEDGTGEFTVCW